MVQKNRNTPLDYYYRYEVATLDKYEYKVRTDEMKQLIKEAKFAEAMEIADSIDWRRVKNTKMLCVVSDIYKINHKFEESKEILLLAYEKNQTSRLIVYSLCELCIKMDEVVEANEYLKEFIRLAPKDNGRYILRYKMLEAQDVSLEERISVLEEYKKREPLSEKWAYELAYLYHRVGLVTRCIEECDQLFLWFREGKYVLKALELKQLHLPLTAEQQYVYDQQFYNTNRTHIPKTAYDDAEKNIEVPPMDVSEYNTINLQKELAESMKEILPTQTSADGVTVEEVLFSDTSAEAPPIFEEPLVYEAPIDLTLVPESLIDEETEVELSEEEVLAMEALEATMAEGALQVVEPLAEEAVEELVIEDITDESVEDIANQVTKVYKAITDEMIMQATGKVVAPKASEPEAVVSKVQITPEPETGVKTAGLKEQKLQENMTAKLPVEMARMLSQEYDGQIRLVVPETEQVEKQITGQLNIIDVMAEWEKIKKATEEKRAEEVRQRVLEHTGNIFVEFDEVSNKKDILAGVDLIEEEPTEDDVAEMVTEEESVTAEVEEEVIETEEIEFEVSEEVDEEAEEEDSEEDEETEEEVFEEDEETEEDEVFEEEEDSEEEEDFEEEEDSEEDEVFEEDEDSEEEEDFEEDEEAEEEEDFEEDEEAEEDFEEDEETEEEEVLEEDEETGEIEENSKTTTQVRAFTSEEKMLFNSFIQTKKDKKKLVEALDEMSLAAYTGNVVITGEEAADTTTLAKAMIKSMQISDSNFSGKVAKITGAGLENKDIKEVLEKLENGALIIEAAHKMSKQSVDKLYKQLEREDKGIIVIMEGPKGSMNKFMDKNDQLNKVFTARFDITGFSNTALVEYAKRYAREQEYSLDELAGLALHSRIDNMQTNDHKVTVDEVKAIVDEAIVKANKKNLKHFFDVLCSNRYDEEDMIILREKDFEV